MAVREDLSRRAGLRSPLTEYVSSSSVTETNSGGGRRYSAEQSLSWYASFPTLAKKRVPRAATSKEQQQAQDLTQNQPFWRHVAGLNTTVSAMTSKPYAVWDSSRPWLVWQNEILHNDMQEPVPAGMAKRENKYVSSAQTVCMPGCVYRPTVRGQSPYEKDPAFFLRSSECFSEPKCTQKRPNHTKWLTVLPAGLYITSGLRKRVIGARNSGTMESGWCRILRIGMRTRDS